MNEENQYPKLSDKERLLLLNILHKKDSASDVVLLNNKFWQHIKHYYWELEDQPELNKKDLALLLILIDEIDPRRCDKVDDAVSKATLRYLKRKARRFMKKIGNTNPELYLFLAKELILSLDILENRRELSAIEMGNQPFPYLDNENYQSENKKHYSYFKEGILNDFRSRYVLAYVIFGESKHVRQLNKGNGSIVFDFWKLRIKEEGMPFPNLWKEHSVEMENFHFNRFLPWYALDFLMRVQHLNHKSLQFGDAKQTCMRLAIQSPSPYLQKEAMDALQEIVSENVNSTKSSFLKIFSSTPTTQIPVDVLAYAYYKMPPKLRTIVDEKILPQIQKSKQWSETFYYTLVGSLYFKYGQKENYPISNKLRKSIACLEKSSVADLFNAHNKESMAYLLLNAGSENMQASVLEILEKQNIYTLVSQWFDRIDKNIQLHRDYFFAAFTKHFQKMNWEAQRVFSMVLTHEDDQFMALSWKILSQRMDRLDGYYDLYSVWNAIETNFAKGEENFEKWLSLSEYIPQVLRALIKKSSMHEICNLNNDLLKYILKDDEIAKNLQQLLRNNFENDLSASLKLLWILPGNLSKGVLLQEHKRALVCEFESYYWSLDRYMDAWFSLLQNEKSTLWRFLEQLMKEAALSDTFWSKLINALTHNENQKIAFQWLRIFTNSNHPDLTEHKESIVENLWISIVNNSTEDFLNILEDDLIQLVIKEVENSYVIHWMKDMDENSWQQVRKWFLFKAAHTKDQLQFWKDMLSIYLEVEDKEEFTSRFWNDPEIEALFNQLNNISLLDINHIDAEDLLCKWVYAQKALFADNKVYIQKLVTHRLPKVRDLGWEMITNITIDVIFMLKLAECGIPEVLIRANEWFRNIPEKTEEETHAILALCDSPKAEVRQLGMDLISERKEILSYDKWELLPCLSEHPDVYVQQQVAESLEKLGTAPQFAIQFDREVMRQRNAARKAKESIKRRLEKQEKIDTDLLLEIAKSQDKQDAEWAILQLTKMALAEEVSTDVFTLI